MPDPRAPAARKALFYQPDCGISGDMHMAALLDLGVDPYWLREQLARLPISSEYRLEITRSAKMGIAGTQVRVHTQDQSDHRHHSTIVDMIKKAGYARGVEQRALAIFDAIAQAEGKIHGVAPQDVHFHEVGAVDSIIDIVAAALCIESLEVDAILCGSVEVGAGFVDCAHGRFPVPAPATQEILHSAPCTYGGVRGESTTPTGAAILAACVTEFLPQGMFTPHSTGYGIGHKDFTRPNVLRAALGSYIARDVSAVHYKIEANIDDMSPEAYEPLMHALLDAGADDVYLQPIHMKKNRPAQCLSVLCAAAQKDALADLILNASSTIGLRVYPFEKRVLPRESRTISTTLGDVRVKIVTQPDGRKRWKPEHEDVQRLAARNALDYPTARRTIEADVQTALNA